VKILVDTHVYLWMLSAPEKFDDTRRYELESQSNEVFLSSISIAELMIKQSIGKMERNFNPMEMAQKMGLEMLNFSGDDAIVLGDLTFHHRDPFDRMLIAQAITNNLVLMSDDSKFREYNCKTI
jgi:PIN domain nuclease of toxin-antitoxin system